MPERPLLLVNPRARRGEAAQPEVEDCLRTRRMSPMTEEVTDRLAEVIRARAGLVDSVVVAGGDGTLNSVLQHLVGTRLPLGVIPLGTANNLARTLGIPTELPRACDGIAAGVRRYIDVGRVNDCYFFTTASIGLSVEITESLSSETKRRWGALAYAVAAVRTLARSRPFHADISWPGGQRHTRTVQIVVGNGRYYGSGLPVAPDATIDDATLDLYSLEVRHWWELLGLAPALKRGRHGEKRSVEALRSTQFRIATRLPLEINVDGEIRSRTPAELEVLPRALEVFAPPAWTK